MHKKSGCLADSFDSKQSKSNVNVFYRELLYSLCFALRLLVIVKADDDTDADEAADDESDAIAKPNVSLSWSWVNVG